jgi:hypothetical protein
MGPVAISDPRIELIWLRSTGMVLQGLPAALLQSIVLQVRLQHKTVLPPVFATRSFLVCIWVMLPKEEGVRLTGERGQG